MNFFFKSSILFAFLFHFIHGANILFLFGGGNYSHKHSIWPLVMALTQKGHNVTFVSSVEKQPTPNPNVVDITPTFMKKLTEGLYEVDRFRDRKEGNERNMFKGYEGYVLAMCKSIYSAEDDPQLANMLENGQYDLAVVNHYCGDCLAYIAHHFTSKYVLFDSTTIMPLYYNAYGIPFEFSWLTEAFISHIQYPMTYWDRFRSMLVAWMFSSGSAQHEEALRQAYKERFKVEDSEAPELIQLQRNAALVLINTHYATDYARSLPPMFVHIGGMQCWEPEGILPQNFKEFMDGAEEGVILISFGSTIEFNKLSEPYLSIFFNMMKKFSKVRFIWRWNGPLHANQPKNLLGAKWLPQKEILREKSVRALMTHGGMNSQHEAAYYGVPMIVMPLFADQDFQAYRVQAQDIGVKVEAADFSQEFLDDAVWKILNTPTYKKNMEIRSKLFRDRPSPTQTAVEALEFVLRHDDVSILKPMALEQSWVVRRHIDIYFFLFSVLTIVNFLVPYILWRICRKVFVS